MHEVREPERAEAPDPDALQSPAAGAGPLLERDYWAVIEGAQLEPAEVAALVARRFTELAPPSLVRFHRRSGEGELEVGDEMDVHIAGAGRFGVRIIHRDACSVTIGTLEGHPEAGRITFGAYRHHSGDVIFHIRSRARSGSGSGYLGFLFAGDPMQTNTWTDLINRLAATAGRGVAGAVHAEKRHVDPEPGDAAMDRPTFIAAD